VRLSAWRSVVGLPPAPGKGA
jgi:hypothetical protein